MRPCVRPCVRPFVTFYKNLYFSAISKDIFIKYSEYDLTILGIILASFKKTRMLLQAFLFVQDFQYKNIVVRLLKFAEYFCY